MSTTQTLPHWDMTVVYPSMESHEFAQGFARVIQDINDLAHLFDTYKIQDQPAATSLNSAPIRPANAVGAEGTRKGHPYHDTKAGRKEDETIRAFETVVERYNTVLTATRTLSAYIICFVTTNSHDTLAQARWSELQQATVILSQLGTRFTAWIGSLDVEALIERSPIAHDHAFMLRKAKVQATHLMTPLEEALAAELNISSGTAWEKLHGDLTSQLTVPLELSGQPPAPIRPSPIHPDDALASSFAQAGRKEQKLPMSMVRNLAYEPDRDVRRRAYEAELAAWKRSALPLAAALNSIKGEVNTLAKRRGWESALDASLFHNNMDRQTLDAMLTAARESFPDLRRYLRAKARVLGIPHLAWYDLFAPISRDEKVWHYDDAAAFIIEQFGTYSTRLSDFAAQAFHDQWIDAEPREGKQDGAYCISLRGAESRIFANYKSAFGGVSTLAHELGHGYHDLNLAHRTMLQRTTPAALAETASTFCETIIRQAALQRVSPQEQIAILEASLQGSCQIVVDITSRFLFEQRLFEARRKRELSIHELNNLMLEAQKETYGDGLDQSTLHPYMWAMKPHYYSTELSFYNYPYMFGLLFGLGLYARYQQDPETFKQGYDDLLSSTGMADAATLASQFGIDIHSVDFWRSCLDIIREDIERFEELTG